MMPKWYFIQFRRRDMDETWTNCLHFYFLAHERGVAEDICKKLNTEIGAYEYRLPPIE